MNRIQAITLFLAVGFVFGYWAGQEAKAQTQSHLQEASK